MQDQFSTNFVDLLYEEETPKIKNDSETREIADITIDKIKSLHTRYGSNLCFDLINMSLSELPTVQEAFPNHVIEHTHGKICPCYEIRPKT